MPILTFLSHSVIFSTGTFSTTTISIIYTVIFFDMTVFPALHNSVQTGLNKMSSITN